MIFSRADLSFVLLRCRAASFLADRSGADLSNAPSAHYCRFPAGGGADIVARLVGQALSERLSQPFIIENRPGAASNIATEAVVRAPAIGVMSAAGGMTGRLAQVIAYPRAHCDPSHAPPESNKSHSRVRGAFRAS
jgi:tripartite-type tricarboxylate transporter receptor subunit TctC